MSQLTLPVFLVVNYLVNPLGIQDATPRLGWQLAPQEARRGVTQSAYEIRVSSQPGGPADLWDSGRIESDASIQIPYGGTRLPSRTRAYWQVTLWDDKGQSATSAAGSAYWETGQLDRKDWVAQWIGAPWFGAGQNSERAPYLRRSFTLGKKPVNARLYVTALGLYEIYLNGARVGDDSFTPGWTDYHKRVQYQVYDITASLVKGENVVGAILGDGWYCGHVSSKPRELYGNRPKLLAQMEVTFSDGSTQVISTDGTWQLASGPILEDDLIMGESYDARQELAGWLGPNPHSAEWQPACVFADPGIELSPMLDRPVSPHETVAAVSEPRMTDGHRFIYDFGQNLVGTVTLKVRAPAGTTIKLRYGEMLDAKGGVYVENLRSARATDYYTCRGDRSGETWTPSFTYHGFRYAELSGLPGDAHPERDTLKARVLYTDLSPSGDFTCSDPLINQLQHNIQWSQRGNYLEVPTDCPQRDERLGWTGDAQAFIRTGAWNRDVAGFFTKWQRDIGDAQANDGSVPAVVPSVDASPGDGGPAWSDAAIICPWTVYQSYGDLSLLAEHFEQLRRYVDFLGSESLDDIRLHPALGKWAGFGDWLALDGSGKTDGGTPKDLIATAFYAYDARLLSSMARALQRPQIAEHYEAIAAQVTAAFQKRFVAADGLVAGDTQTGYVLALRFDLVPAELRSNLADRLVRDIRRRGNKLSTGFVGTPHLLHVLTREGRLDVAYDLLFQKDWPSWLYPVTQGATTIWERWDGWTATKGFEDKGMNSFNHYAYGAVGDWLYRVVAGVEIDPAHPGYKHFLLQPRPGGVLTSARGAHHSPYGEIVSDWRLEDRAFEWVVVIPPNTTASARLPVPKTSQVTESGDPAEHAAGISHYRVQEDGIACDLVSGEYHFKATWAD